MGRIKLNKMVKENIKPTNKKNRRGGRGRSRGPTPYQLDTMSLPAEKSGRVIMKMDMNLPKKKEYETLFKYDDDSDVVKAVGVNEMHEFNKELSHTDYYKTMVQMPCECTDDRDCSNLLVCCFICLLCPIGFYWMLFWGGHQKSRLQDADPGLTTFVRECARKHNLSYKISAYKFWIMFEFDESAQVPAGGDFGMPQMPGGMPMMPQPGYAPQPYNPVIGQPVHPQPNMNTPPHPGMYGQPPDIQNMYMPPPNTNYPPAEPPLPLFQAQPYDPTNPNLQYAKPQDGPIGN